MEEIDYGSIKINCKFCGNPVNIEVFEVETETGFPTEGGYHVGCLNT